MPFKLVTFEKYFIFVTEINYFNANWKLLGQTLISNLLFNSLIVIKPLNLCQPTTFSNTLKQFVSKLLKNCLSVFDQFVELAFKGLNDLSNVKSLLFIGITSYVFFCIWIKRGEIRVFLRIQSKCGHAVLQYPTYARGSQSSRL